MRPTSLILLTACAVSACDSPPPQPQQDNLVNATTTDQAFPSGADGNDVFTGAGTGAAPAGEEAGQQQGPPPQ